MYGSIFSWRQNDTAERKFIVSGSTFHIDSPPTAKLHGPLSLLDCQIQHGIAPERLVWGSFHVNSTNFLELSSMTTSEFEEIFRKWSTNIPKKACKISG